MIAYFHTFFRRLAWLYTALIVGWIIAHFWFGDRVWWLALLNPLASFLFTPLLFFCLPLLLLRDRRFWLALLAPIVIFLVLYGELFLPAWPAKTSTKSPPITVMTFNIWGGSYRKKTAQSIRANGLPDIVALQELHPFMIRLLLPLVGAYYPYHEFDLRGTGMGVFSRYPLRKIIPSFKLQPGWQLQMLQVQVEERTFILYNCHPRSTDIFRGLRQGWAFANEVDETFRMRLQFAQSLLDDLKTRHEPVVVLGDFNSPDGSDVHQLLLHRLNDAHRRAGWGFGHTFPAQQGYSHGLPIFRRLTRIDMIFYSSDFVALSSHVGAASGESDHLPVLATLAWHY